MTSDELLEFKDKIACMVIGGEDVFMLDNVWEILFLEPAERIWEWITERKLDIVLKDNGVQYVQDGRVFYEEVFEGEGG